eukprot:gene4352-5082_t
MLPSTPIVEIVKQGAVAVEEIRVAPQKGGAKPRFVPTYHVPQPPASAGAHALHLAAHQYHTASLIKQVHVVVKNTPFGITLHSNDVSRINFHNYVIKATLLYDCDPPKPVDFIHQEPLQYVATVSDEGEEVVVDIKMSILSSQHQGSLFIVVLHVTHTSAPTPSNSEPIGTIVAHVANNALTSQALTQLCVISHPIRIVSKVDHVKKEGIPILKKKTFHEILTDKLKRLQKAQEGQDKWIRSLYERQNRKFELTPYQDDTDEQSGDEDELSPGQDLDEGAPQPPSSTSGETSFQNSFNRVIEAYKGVSTDDRREAVRRMVEALRCDDLEQLVRIFIEELHGSAASPMPRGSPDSSSFGISTPPYMIDPASFHLYGIPPGLQLGGPLTEADCPCADCPSKKELERFQGLFKGVHMPMTPHQQHQQQLQQQQQQHPDQAAFLLNFNLQDIASLLADYYVEVDSDHDEEVDYGMNEVPAIAADEEQTLQDTLQPSQAPPPSQEISDDEDCYKSFDTPADSSFLAEYYHRDVVVDTWTSASQKILDIYTSFSYDHVSQDVAWEDFSMTEDIQAIIASLFKETADHQGLSLSNLIPNFIYLLRDRVVHKPTEIPYNLPILLDILHVDADPTTILSPFQFKTLLSIYDSLSSIPSSGINKRSMDYLTKSITDNLIYLVKRIAFWSSIPSDQLSIIKIKDELQSTSTLETTLSPGNYQLFTNQTLAVIDKRLIKIIGQQQQQQSNPSAVKPDKLERRTIELFKSQLSELKSHIKTILLTNSDKLK